MLKLKVSMKIRFSVVFSCLFLCGILSFSCEEDFDFKPAVVTEDVIFASGEKLRISGRIITNQRIEAIDHGFLVADNPSFNQSLKISLGERQNPGRFLGEITGLNIDTRYYVRAFVDLSTELLEGNTIEVQTLIPSAFDFTPNNGPDGSVVSISGKNFTADTEVFFGTVKAEVIDIDFESVLRVRVPPIAFEPMVNIRVINQGREIIFNEKFSYRIGEYIKVSNFPFAGRVFDGISLQEGNTFYFGKGSDRGQAVNPNFWRFQIGNTNWEAFDFPVGDFWRAFSSTSYFGGGFNRLVAPEPRREFFRLENGALFQLENLPFNVVDAAAFELQGKLYLAGGALGQEIRKYSPEDASWVISGSTPFFIDYTFLNFSYGSRQYFINQENGEMYAFDAITEEWGFISVYPSSLGNGRGVAVTVGDKAYVGLGNRSAQMWEFDLVSNNWIRKNDFPGSLTERTEASFLWEGKIYFVRSAEVQVFGVPAEFWVFDPFSF